MPKEQKQFSLGQSEAAQPRRAPGLMATPKFFALKGNAVKHF
jgi:hypothetical protein